MEGELKRRTNATHKVPDSKNFDGSKSLKGLLGEFKRQYVDSIARQQNQIGEINSQKKQTIAITKALSDLFKQCDEELKQQYGEIRRLYNRKEGIYDRLSNLDSDIERARQVVSFLLVYAEY